MNCINCGEPIREWNGVWFHTLNLVTYCLGSVGELQDGCWTKRSTEASPADLELT